MWCNIKDSNLVDKYKKEFIGEPPHEILQLLSQLQKKKYPKEFFAVTTLGKLRFTTASDYSIEKHHNSIGVVDKEEGFFIMYVLAGDNVAKEGRECKSSELMSVVECFLIELLLG